MVWKLRIYSSPKEVILNRSLIGVMIAEWDEFVYSDPSVSDLSGCDYGVHTWLQMLGYRTSRGLEIHQVSIQHNNTEDNFDKVNLDDQESETTDD